MEALIQDLQNEDASLTSTLSSISHSALEPGYHVLAPLAPPSANPLKKTTSEKLTGFMRDVMTPGVHQKSSKVRMKKGGKGNSIPVSEASNPGGGLLEEGGRLSLRNLPGGVIEVTIPPT